MSDSNEYNHHVDPGLGRMNLPGLKSLFRRFVLRYWYFYIIFPFIGLIIAFLILRYEIPIYQVQSKLLVKSEATSSELNEKAIFQGMDIPVISRSLENEIQILRSASLIERVVDSLRLNWQLFQVGRVQNTEIYTGKPIRLDSASFGQSFNQVTFFIRPISKDVFLFGEDLDNMSEQIFGLPFDTKYGRLSISFNEQTVHINKDFILQIKDKQRVSREFNNRLIIRPYGASDLLLLSITDEIPRRGVDFLNMLTELYEQDAIQFLNKVNRNTIEWVEKRINEVETQLNNIEDAEERYLLNEDLPVSLEVSTQKALEKEATLSSELRTLRSQKEVLDDYRSSMINLLDYKSFLPAGLLTDWPKLEEQVAEINAQIEERESKLVSGTELNPIIGELKKRITTQKEDLFTDVRLRIRNLNALIRDKENELRQVALNIYKTPRREREIRNIDRQKMTVEATFRALLQQREQIQLSMAVASPNVRVVEAARSVGVIQRNPISLYVMSAGLGLVGAVFLVSLLELLNDKVQSEEEAKQLSSLTSVGSIPLHKPQEQIVFDHYSQSVIAEMFRLLRTNLQFIIPDKEKASFLVTSSTSGEGKTFVSINLGLALASSNKRVVIVELDLRQPKLATYLDVSNKSRGVTNYIVGDATFDEITRPYHGDDRLHYITAGPIPPNPSELLLTDKLRELISNCQDRYDYVLLDSPPIAIVADAFVLKEFVDSTLVVARQNFTKKSMLKFIRENKERGRLQSPHLIYNGVRKSDQYGFRYGYGYYTKS